MADPSAACLVLITDPRTSVDAYARILAESSTAVLPGSIALQVRDKTSAPSVRSDRARRLAELARRHDFPVLLNAPTTHELLLAHEIAADGIHVPCTVQSVQSARDRGPVPAVVSVPCHSVEDVATAQGSGAHWVLVSPIFDVPGKGPPRGVQAIQESRTLAPSVRVFALGGVDVCNVHLCAAAGASGVAVMRAMSESPTPGRVAHALCAPFGRAT